MKHNDIRDCFTSVAKFKQNGIYFSGVSGEGEFKMWDGRGKLWYSIFFKNNRKDGVFKMWNVDGRIDKHELYKKGELVKDYLK